MELELKTLELELELKTGIEFLQLLLQHLLVNQPFNKGYETDGFNNNDFMYMNLVIIITINFDEEIIRSFLELRLDLNSPESELELELKCLELELELKLIGSSGIGIGIENNGIGIELKKRNWAQPWKPYGIISVNFVSGNHCR